MKHLSKTQLFVQSLLFAGVMTSCIDNSYDLDDVDYVIGAETDLTLPVCSTDTIFLRNFMDLKEDGVVQFVWDPVAGDSVFCVKQSGEADVDPVHINEIRIAQPQLSDFYASVDLRQLLGGQQKQRRVRITIDTPAGPQTVELPSQTFHYDILPGVAGYNIVPAEAKGISADVVSIDRVGIDAVKVTLNVVLVGFPAHINTVHYDQFELHCPEGLQITEARFNGKACAVTDNTVALTPDMDETSHVIADGVKMELTLAGLEEGETFRFDAVQHTATFQGLFELTGTLRVETDEFLSEELEKLDYVTLLDIAENGDFSAIVPERVSVNGEAGVDGDLVLKTFSGQLVHNVGAIDPIKLDDLPDFLNDGEVVLDLDNPLLLLDLHNGLPSVVNTTITLTSNTCNTPVTAGMAMAPDANKFYIADKEAASLPQEYASASRLASSGSVAGLIRKIPDQVDVDVAPCTMEAVDFDITRSYDIDIHYDIFAPLTFGDDFALVYKDTEDGWAKDMDDVKDLNADLLEVTAQLDNALPAGLKLSLVPIDSEGNRISQLLVDEIAIDAQKRNQPVKINIKPAAGHTINDALAGKNGVKQLDGIRYEARLQGNSGETLYRKAAIKIHDIRVSIKGKFTYDAN